MQLYFVVSATFSMEDKLGICLCEKSGTEFLVIYIFDCTKNSLKFSFSLE